VFLDVFRRKYRLKKLSDPSKINPEDNQRIIPRRKNPIDLNQSQNDLASAQFVCDRMMTPTHAEHAAKKSEGMIARFLISFRHVIHKSPPAGSPIMSINGVNVNSDSKAKR